MRVTPIAALGLGLLTSACATLGPADLEYPAVEAAARRAFIDTVTEQPFALGEMSVVSAEAGELRTYALVPCGTGGVCAGSETGPRGRLTHTPDFTVVDGLYGRRFWLSPGGSGVVERGLSESILAWNGDANGVIITVTEAD